MEQNLLNWRRHCIFVIELKGNNAIDAMRRFNYDLAIWSASTLKYRNNISAIAPPVAYRHLWRVPYHYLFRKSGGKMKKIIFVVVSQT
jgi:hypothetical protein